MSVKGVQQRIEGAVTSWAGVEAHPHRFGGREFRLGKRELGHIHGDRLVDIPFPVKVREELVSRGLAQTHHVLPESGWVSVHLREDADVDRAVGLLGRSYGLALEQRSRRERAQPTTEKKL